MQPCIWIIISALIYLTNGFGPRKLYSLNLPTDIVSIKVIGNQIFYIGPWYIGVVDNVQWKFRQIGRMNPRIMNKDIPNPRMIGKIPDGTFKVSKNTAFWATSWKTNDTTGAVYVLQQTADYSEKAIISVGYDWSYETTQWVDMDRDGLKDCLTARFSSGVGQMVWFKQPPGQAPWEQNIIHEKMSDGNFLGFLYNKKTYIVVTGNQFNTLGLFWTQNRRNIWSEQSQVSHRIVDNSGSYFDVQYIDLNKDGRSDILTTTIKTYGSRGEVLGYEIPKNIQKQKWTRHVLATGFVHDYAPGKATAFWTNKWKQKSDRPSIFLSGAGEEKLFILSPTPRESGWSYVKSTIEAGVGMIGIPHLIDLDGDSYPEIFVPQGKQLHVFSYDYATSVALPPLPAVDPSSRTTTTRAPVPFVHPFFRPTTPPPPPAIPVDALPVGPLPNYSEQLLSPSLPPVNNHVSSKRPEISTTLRLTTIQRENTRSTKLLPSNSSVQHSTQPLIPFQQINSVPDSHNNNFNPSNSQFTSLENQTPSNPSREAENNPTILPSTKIFTVRNNKQNKIGPVNVINQQFIPIQDQDLTHSTTPLDPTNLIPPNLLLYVTQEKFAFHSEALDACSRYNRVLCSLEQLHNVGIIGGPVPDFDWGWFAQRHKAASTKKCENGVLKWNGYTCHNGNVEVSRIINTPNLPALCCSVVKWATLTISRFSLKRDAEFECRKGSSHLCSLGEMMRVWDESSYKGFQWGWFDSKEPDMLIRMSHHCNTNDKLWPSYKCIAKKFELTKILNLQQEKAFCCPNRGNAARYSILILAFSAVLTVFNIDDYSFVQFLLTLSTYSAQT